jgi:hypothetical protein
MNKKLLIGVGALAVLGIGGYLWWKKGQTSGSSSSGSEGGDTRSADVSAPETTMDESAGAGSDTPPPQDLVEVPASKTVKEARQQRRQTRRDCRAEAITKGYKPLSGKRRKFMAECKRAGGINADFAGEQADFAFNGNIY